MQKILAVLAFVALGLSAGAAYTAEERTTRVGGQAMLPSKDIVDNAVNSADHTTLVAAVKAAGLVETLKGPGPFRSGREPRDRSGSSTGELRKRIQAGHGQAALKTASGGTLWILRNGEENLALQDEQGNVSNLTISNVYQSNGVIQVIDTVLMPK
jgi:uncharacterized surface protein with fasciclin (FAS1) repeats